MQSAKSSPDTIRYNAEVNMLDDLYEFHPVFFDDLEPAEFQALTTYYLTGRDDIPDNIFEYRLELIKAYPDLQPRAEQAYTKLLALAGIKPHT